MIITITMRLNRDEENKELWLRVRQKKEFSDLHELFEKIFCIPDTSAPVERSSAQVDYPCSHTVHAWAISY